jgi:hypothetical protein
VLVRKLGRYVDRPDRKEKLMRAKETWAAVPLDQPIPLVAGCLAFGIVGGLVVYVALKGWIPYLWREWITSVDHKHIGVMYVFLATLSAAERATPPASRRAGCDRHKWLRDERFMRSQISP